MLTLYISVYNKCFSRSRDKFILAYLPRVLLYYNSRIIFNIDPVLSADKLEGIITNFTGKCRMHTAS